MIPCCESLDTNATIPRSVHTSLLGDLATVRKTMGNAI